MTGIYAWFYLSCNLESTVVSDEAFELCRSRVKEYLPITGLADFNKLSAKLILGADRYDLEPDCLTWEFVSCDIQNSLKHMLLLFLYA